MSRRKPTFPSGYDPPGYEHGSYVSSSNYAATQLNGIGRKDGADRHIPGVVSTHSYGWGEKQASQGRLWKDDEYVGDVDYIDCPDCISNPGRNVLDDQPNEECPTCDGLGEVPVCKRCHGTGESPTTMSVACARCEGVGIDPGDEPVPQAKFQAPAKPEPLTWRNKPWDVKDSMDAAKSGNLFTRLYGQYRDMRLGYFSCPENRHWGPRGGAGMVPVALVDGHPLVLLSHRSKFVEQGGTWSSFGGAIDEKDKNPFAAAVRETFEEVTGLPKKGNVIGKIEHPCHACGWTYTTFVVLVEAPPADLLKVTVTKGTSSWETEGIAWVPDWFVEHYPLHPGFAKSWPQVREFITKAVKGGTS